MARRKTDKHFGKTPRNTATFTPVVCSLPDSPDLVVVRREDIEHPGKRGPSPDSIRASFQCLLKGGVGGNPYPEWYSSMKMRKKNPEIRLFVHSIEKAHIFLQSRIQKNAEGIFIFHSVPIILELFRSHTIWEKLPWE